jgi:SAM-dependent methyltransferase
VDSSDPRVVRAQYADESRLLTRTAVWRGTADGRQPQDVAAELIAGLRPARLLEVGCGTGTFAARLMTDRPGADMLAVDRSPRLAHLAARRGVPVCVADIQALPIPDDSVDLVAALWMLYHVPDLDRGLAQVRRVLRPDGRLVAVTNGERHLGELFAAAGGEPSESTFSGENGERALRHHFDEVSRTDLTTYAEFADHAAAQAYLATFSDRLVESLPWFSGTRTCTGHVTVFVAG